MSKNYLNIIHNIQAHLRAADKCMEECDTEGDRSLREAAYELWGEVEDDLKAGVEISSDGWDNDSRILLGVIKERVGGDE